MSQRALTPSPQVLFRPPPRLPAKASVLAEGCNQRAKSAAMRTYRDNNLCEDEKFQTEKAQKLDISYFYTSFFFLFLFDPVADELIRPRTTSDPFSHSVKGPGRLCESGRLCGAPGLLGKVVSVINTERTSVSCGSRRSSGG